MIIANRPLNQQALVLELAETEIRQIVNREYKNQTPKYFIDRLISQVLKTALAKIKINELRKAAAKSLLVFYKRQYDEISRVKPSILAVALLLSAMANGVKTPKNSSQILKSQSIKIERGLVDFPRENIYGVPLKKFSEDYFNDNVKPVFERLVNQYPMDPDDLSGHLSLRGRAELEVRYNYNLEMVENLKEEGHKLVICSTHADCSERCAKWQGRVYSLDGTSGTTDDGRKYVPLETATDVYYTTKAGKTYKNGLLGFNCRHFLVPYKSGFKFPKPNVAEERKQREITAKQRELERRVIKWKTEAIEYKGINKEKYEFARQKAKEWDDVYIKYSKQNNRAYYPSRTEIFVEGKDLIEYKKLQRYYSTEESIKTFDLFKNLKYNKPSEYAKLLDGSAQKYISNEIKSGKYSLYIEEGKQQKHYLEHKNYIQGKSYLTVDIKEVQNLVYKHAGNGLIENPKEKVVGNKELVIFDKNIGFVKDISGKWIPTNRAKIHYSKKGVHVVPTLKEIDNDN